MRRASIALATLFFFGCATVQRAPVPQAGPVQRVALAEPELELWMEGTAPGPIDPAESARSLAAARAALAGALDGRGFAAGGEADQVLVVRAAAVVRAEERRGRQTAATIGAVLLVVAVIAILVAASRNGGGRGHGRGAGHVAAPAPPRGGGGPGPRFHPPVYRRPLYPAPWPWWGFGIHVHVPVAPMAVVPGPGGVPYGAPTLPARLAGRGFWDSDEVELVLELRDARDGRMIWTRATRAEVDVRDAARLRQALDRALWDQPWALAPPPGAAPPVPPPSPPANPPASAPAPAEPPPAPAGTSP